MSNIALLLRDISNTSDKKSAKIICKCNRAAGKGKSAIKVIVSEADWNCIYYSENHKETVLISKLKGYGFQLYHSLEGGFLNLFRNRIIWVEW